MSKHAAHVKAANKNLPHHHQAGQQAMAAAEASALPPSLARQFENLLGKHGKHDAAHHHSPPADAASETYVLPAAPGSDSGNGNSAISGAVMGDAVGDATGAAGAADPSIILAGGTVGAVSPAEATAAPPLAAAPIAEAAPVIAAPAGFGIPGALLGGLALAGLAAAAGGGGSSGGAVSSAGSASGGPTPVTPTPAATVTTAAGGATLGASEATTTTGVTVTPTAGATVTGVVVSGVSATCPDDIISVTATPGADSNYTFDATQFANGPINVTVTELDANGGLHTNIVVLDKETGPVSINGHEYLSAADVAANTPLIITTHANAAITGVTVTGTDANGHPLTETATADANGVYRFDATQFADGAITVDVAEKDASGNPLPDTIVQLVKDTSVVSVSGVPSLNIETATADASLTVTPDHNAAISTVTITGTDANGNPLTESATLESDGKFHFDAAKFADGGLAVHVVENSNGATVTHDVTIIKDTSAPAAVSTDNHLTLNDVDANGQAALAAHAAANEHLTGVTVAGLDLNGQPLVETAAIDASGKIHFNAAPFADGPLTLMISAANAAGNQEVNVLTITKDTAVVNVGGDNVLSASEISGNGAATLAITPFVIAGEGAITGPVTITGVDANGHPVTVTAAPGDNGQLTFDASPFADGVLTVAVPESTPGCPAETEIVQIVKDTSLVRLDSVNTLSVNDDCGQIGNATLAVNPSAGAEVTGVTVTGTGLNGQPLTETATVDANGQYHFDATQFANGSLTANVSEQGVATPLTETIGLNTATVTAGQDGILDASEATNNAALAIAPGAGDQLADITAVTVTGADANGNPLTEQAALGADGKFHFDATPFANGSLTVSVTEDNGAGDHSVTLLKDTSATLAGGLILDADAATQAAALNIIPGADQTVEAVQVAGIGLNGQPLTEAATLGLDGHYHFDATQFADGQLHVNITEANCAGVDMEHTLTIAKDVVATPNTVTDGDTTINDTGLTATTYNFTPDSANIHLVAVDHDVINLIGGNGTVHLDVDPVRLQFAELAGNASGGSIDSLSLTTPGVTLDLSHYNNIDQGGVLEHFEHINLHINGGQTVILSAQDLFNEHSDLNIGGNSAVVIDGDASDTVNISGLTQQSGSFDATGHASANGGYNLYTGSAVDNHGVDHQVDLLLQHAVMVAHA